MFETLANLKKKRKGQYFDNIVADIKLNHGWSDEIIREVLNNMMGEKLLRKVKVNGKDSYRVLKNDLAFFTDNSSATVDMSNESIVEPSSDDLNLKESLFILQQDFMDFKKFVTDKFGVMDCNCNNSFKESNEIATLKDHIKSLEKQLNDKQKIIDGLINSKEPIIHSAQNTNKKSLSKENLLSPKVPKNDKDKKSDMSKKQKKIFIVGDSLLNGISEKGFKKSNVSVKPHPGATSNDLTHYIKPIVHKKPDTIIVHCGTNDISNNIKTIDHLKMIDDYIKSNSPDTKLVISSLIIRKDKVSYEKNVSLMNERLEKFTTKNNIDFINNHNVNESCLSRSKLHLNRKGNSVLANNFITYVNK